MYQSSELQYGIAAPTLSISQLIRVDDSHTLRGRNDIDQLHSLISKAPNHLKSTQHHACLVVFLSLTLRLGFVFPPAFLAAISLLNC